MFSITDNRKIDSSGRKGKINRKGGKEKQPLNSSQRPGKDFKAKLAAVEKEMIREKLDEMLAEVDEHGEKLKRTVEKQDMLEYKRRVQKFLRFIQQEVARTRQSHSWDRQGNLKTYTIIEKIDEKLDELQKEFLHSQADTLEVVKKIDEIRGLMLDLYI